MNYNIPIDRVRNRHEVKRIIHSIYSKQPPTPKQVAELERLNSEWHNPRVIDFSVLSQASASELTDAFRKEAPPHPHQVQSLSRLGIRDNHMHSMLGYDCPSVTYRTYTRVRFSDEHSALIQSMTNLCSKKNLTCPLRTTGNAPKSKPASTSTWDEPSPCAPCRP